MVSSKSSKKWLQERARDKYVKKSKQAGFRSRASFKLLEIQEKDRFIKPGMIVVDLGSAPGGWSQAAKILVGDKGSVLATDILPMAPISGVKFIQGDFTEDAVFEDLIEKVGRFRRPCNLRYGPQYNRYKSDRSARIHALGGAGIRFCEIYTERRGVFLGESL